MWTIYRKQKTTKNELHKACFQYDTISSYFKGLTRRITSGKVFHDKVFKITNNLQYDGYQRWIAEMVYKFLIKI